MTTTLGTAGSKLNIRLGQSPNIKDPALNYEMQLVYNSLQLLSQYMAALRENLESAPGQTPSESVRFRRRFWAIALQDIAVGAVVSSYGTGVINGIATNLPATVVTDPDVTRGSTGSRTRFELVQQQFFIAVTAATAGQLVQVGAGPGVLQVAGAKCGQIVWGVGAISVDSYRNGGAVEQYTTPGTPVGNGGLYLNNIVGTDVLPGGIIYHWEGYWLPGYPDVSNSFSRYSRAFLYPIGICVSDEFVLFSDYKRSDPLPDKIIS